MASGKETSNKRGLFSKRASNDGDSVRKFNRQKRAWEWRNSSGELHRLDGPAYEEKAKGGTKAWFQHGQLHRDGDLPARENADGSEEWYQHGLLHRNGDLPAFEDVEANFYKWYQNGKLHRDNDQPAFANNGKMQMWYQHGELHRDNDQPAVIKVDGSEEWYQHGKRQDPPPSRFSKPTPAQKDLQDRLERPGKVGTGYGKGQVTIKPLFDSENVELFCYDHGSLANILIVGPDGTIVGDRDLDEERWGPI